MMHLSILPAILQAARRLSLPQQKSLLAFIEAMQPQASLRPSAKLAQYAGRFDVESVAQMESAIEESDTIDYDEW